MGLRTGAPAAQGRTGPRPLRRSLLAWPPSSWVDDDDRLRLSANPPPRRSERGKKESATDRRSRRCRRSAAPCWQSSPPPRPIDALTAREPSVERSNESAKVVLGLAPCAETRGSRDKPGHDASGPSRAATTCGISVANS